MKTKILTNANLVQFLPAIWIAIIRPNEANCISSLSATLLALVDSLQPLHRKMEIKVVQILGGVGNPAVEAHATRLTSVMAQLLNGEAIYLPVPGVLTTEAARSILIADDVSQKTIKLFDKVTTALVGIGAIDPSPLLAQSGNIFSVRELDLLRKKKAAGDILLHFLMRMATWWTLD
jgi:DNA-binding transcriptional regulator LsrR (DeoR family)